MIPQIEFNLKLAKKVFKAKVFFEGTKNFCEKFICEGEASETVVMSESSIQAEKNFFPNISSESSEIFALHRKLVHALIPHNVLLFHGSAVSLNGNGYIFTAPSGTGKSTHAEKWHRLLGASYVNDDKPLVEIREKAVAYGSPWMGEHNLGENASAPIKAIFVIVRSEENRIEPLSETDAFFELMKQTYIPKNKECSETIISLVKSLSALVKVYKLYCNKNDDAVHVSASVISENTF